MAVTSTIADKQPAVDKKRLRCKKKFFHYFPKAFKDPTYTAWERDYKWNAHLEWEKELNQTQFKKLLANKDYLEIARKAVKIETRTNLLFSFEKMALRDATNTYDSARMFSEGLYHYVYGQEPLKERFERFVDVVANLPRKQTRVLTWPLVTVFGFIARPDIFIFLKPKVTRTAAEKYAFDFQYKSRPSWDTYLSLLEFANQVRLDLADLKPRDMIDLQSFIWVMGSDEYPH